MHERTTNINLKYDTISELAAYKWATKKDVAQEEIRGMTMILDETLWSHKKATGSLNLNLGSL